MKTLLLIFIIWTVISALSKRVKTPPARGPEELPEYRLPPELRQKWGNKSEKAQKREPRAVVLSEPHETQVTESKAVHQPSPCPKDEAGPQARCAEKARGPAEKLLQKGEMSPDMLRNGIILSEVLGPPLVRRRRNRYH